MEVIGIGYLAIICQNIDETINFYCNGLGFEKIYQEPNRDDPESTQVLLMNKNGNGIMLVGPNDPNMKLAEKKLGVGSMQYLALYVKNADLDEAFYNLSNAGIQISEEIQRGYERIIFLEDPNGTLITLISWPGIENIESGQYIEALKTVEEYRKKDKSKFIEKKHFKK
ncbi:MAG: hypothetical protein CL872_05430 [Dehalococcoidaceae bacterium]|nr:hypothetical protein [Dehalococcoidaceae bacterium]|tara:strand:- start:49417 stop:49923 length:507 start_codon:yes stop_codon:yes gene_type:complete